MSIFRTIKERRTIRKFKQKRVPYRLIKKMIEGARFAPSGGNMQPLKYLVVDDEPLRKRIFETLAWAAYLAPHGTPRQHEEPMAYIIVLQDTTILNTGAEMDVGAAVQTMLLIAEEERIGSAWIGSIDRNALRKVCAIPSHYIIHSVIALGYKAEKSKAVPFVNTIRYWKDKKGVLHVPKRSLKSIMFHNKM